MEIGERLRSLLKKYNYTQKGFAEKIGVSQAYVSALCCNSSKPSMETLFLISRALGITIDELFCEDFDARTESMALSNEEYQLICKFRALSDRDKQTIYDLILSLLRTGKPQTSCLSVESSHDEISA